MPAKASSLLATAAGLAVAATFGHSGVAAQTEKFISKAPTASDWAAVARLPDFYGVWEVSPGARAATRPSLTPAYEEKRKVYLDAPPEDSQSANCVPPGMPGIMGQPYPMEFLLTPGKVTIVIEAYTQVRHIYTDGRPLPADPDLEFHGTSVGRWEGDTLVVDTVGFSPLTQIERGVPHSGKMRIVERFRLMDPDTMSIETTITDPEALAAPYTFSRKLSRHRNWTITEYICEENNRNFVDEKGKAGINLTNPGGFPSKND